MPTFKTNCAGCISQKSTHGSEADEVEHEELCVAAGVRGQDDLLKHIQHLAVEAPGPLPLQLTCNTRKPVSTPELSHRE